VAFERKRIGERNRSNKAAFFYCVSESISLYSIEAAPFQTFLVRLEAALRNGLAAWKAEGVDRR